jgi:hypothetical protein
VSFFHELLVSLGLRKRSARIGLRSHRDVTLSLDIEAAHDRVLDALVKTLGANIYGDDRATHEIEAGFGLVNAERVRVTLEIEDATHTRVQIEAHYRAGFDRPTHSQNVDALADALEAGVGN